MNFCTMNAKIRTEQADNSYLQSFHNKIRHNKKAIELAKGFNILLASLTRIRKEYLTKSKAVISEISMIQTVRWGTCATSLPPFV